MGSQLLEPVACGVEVGSAGRSLLGRFLGGWFGLLCVVVGGFVVAIHRLVGHLVVAIECDVLELVLVVDHEVRGHGLSLLGDGLRHGLLLRCGARVGLGQGGDARSTLQLCPGRGWLSRRGRDLRCTCDVAS